MQIWHIGYATKKVRTTTSVVRTHRNSTAENDLNKRPKFRKRNVLRTSQTSVYQSRHGIVATPITDELSLFQISS